MLAILIFLNAHIFPIFQSILMIFVSKFMVYRAPSDQTCISLGLLSPLTLCLLLRICANSSEHSLITYMVSELKHHVCFVQWPRGI